MQIASSPVYLDTSALTKIYLPEPGSDELEAGLEGRRDLLVSDLAISELVSALARRTREGDITATSAKRVYDTLLQDAHRVFLPAELTPSTHRDAEGMLLSVGRSTPLRAADALHLAIARAASASALLTYDRKMAAAAAALGIFELPET